MAIARQWSGRGERRAVGPVRRRAGRGSRCSLPALFAVAMLASGCAVAVGGTAQPVPSSMPRPVGGATITRVLLGHASLSRILKQPMIIDTRFPSRVGGPEALRADEPASSADCIGVAGMLEQSAYHAGAVKGVAVQAWRHAATSVAVTEVKEGVVTLPTSADAEALFAAFAHQWQNCDGRTQPWSDKLFRLAAAIDHVHVTNSVLGATVWLALASNKDAVSVPAGRAVGVRGNCLVEVEVDFFNVSSSSLPGHVGLPSRAEDIAQLIMARIGTLGELTPR